MLRMMLRLWLIYSEFCIQCEMLTGDVRSIHKWLILCFVGLQAQLIRPICQFLTLLEAFWSLILVLVKIFFRAAESNNSFNGC